MLGLLLLLRHLLYVEHLVTAVHVSERFLLIVVLRLSRVVLLVNGVNEALDCVVGLLAVDVDLDDVVHVRSVVVI